MEYIDPANPNTVVTRVEKIREYIEKRLYDRPDMMDALTPFELRLSDFEALNDNVRYAGIDKPLFLYRKAIDKHKYQGALHHLRAIYKIVKVRANDNPFKETDKVRVIRTEHGWDCFDDCVVAEATKNIRGIWQYKVQPVGQDYTYDIAHTRDLVRTYF